MVARFRGNSQGRAAGIPGPHAPLTRQTQRRLTRRSHATTPQPAGWRAAPGSAILRSMFPLGAWLTLKKRERRLVLSIPLSYRILYGALFAICVFVFLFGILFDGEQTPFVWKNTIPLLLTAATFLGLLYDDSWIFDEAAGKIESRFGLVFLHRRRVIPMSALASIELSTFTKGRIVDTRESDKTWFQRLYMPGMMRMAAVDAQGAEHVIEAVKAARAPDLRRIALQIADYCRVPFRER